MNVSSDLTGKCRYCLQYYWSIVLRHVNNCNGSATGKVDTQKHCRRCHGEFLIIISVHMAEHIAAEHRAAEHIAAENIAAGHTAAENIAGHIKLENHHKEETDDPGVPASSAAKLKEKTDDPGLPVKQDDSESVGSSSGGGGGGKDGESVSSSSDSKSNSDHDDDYSEEEKNPQKKFLTTEEMIGILEDVDEEGLTARLQKAEIEKKYRNAIGENTLNRPRREIFQKLFDKAQRIRSSKRDNHKLGKESNKRQKVDPKNPPKNPLVLRYISEDWPLERLISTLEKQRQRAELPKEVFDQFLDDADFEEAKFAREMEKTDEEMYEKYLDDCSVGDQFLFIFQYLKKHHNY